MSVSAAASLVKFSDWSRSTSAQLAKKLESLGIAPKPGKPRRQAQLNLWEMGRALIPSSPGSASIADEAEGRLTELYGLRASEARDLATRHGIASAAEAGHKCLFDLIKLIFVYEFMVARPAARPALDDKNASFPALHVQAGPSSISAAAGTNTMAEPKNVLTPVASSAALESPREARTRELRAKAKMVMDSRESLERDLHDVIMSMFDFILDNETPR